MLPWLIIAVTIFFHLLIIFVLLRNNARSITNRLIVYFSLTSIIWTIFNYLPYVTDSNFLQLTFVRIVMFITAPMGLIIYMLSKVYPNKELQLSRRNERLGFITAIVSTIAVSTLSLTDLVFTELVKLDNGGFELTPGPGIVLYAAVGLGLLFKGLYTLFTKYLKSTGIVKKQLQLFFYGLAISLVLIVLTNLIAVVVFNTVALVFLGPAFSLIIVYAIAYAIIKHRFLDISDLVVRSVAFALLVLVSAIIYISVVFGIMTFFSNQTIDYEVVIIGIISAITLAFSLPYIQKALQALTQKYLFVSKYDSEKLLYEIALVLASNIRLEDLSRALIQSLQEKIRFSHGILFLLDNKRVYQVVTVGEKSNVEIDEQQIDKLTQFKESIFFEEIEDRQIRKVLQSHDAVACIALATKNQVAGILLLGEKLSGEVYSSDDATVLNIIGPQTAISIENAKAYEEIRRFNITLEEEVERATKKLVSANRKLQELDKLKDEFVSIASHELRTPMVSIKNYLWMALAGKGGKLTEKQEFYLQRSYDSANRMTKLINDMLNISRIESGRILLHVDKVNIAELIDRIIDENQPRAKELNITLKQATKVTKRASNEQVELPAVIADPDKVAEVLVNLIGNALKFTPSGGSVTLSLQVDHGYVYVNVTDTGVGLENDQIPKLFKKFGMIKDSYRSYSEAAQGTGLGLYVSKSIMELHEGSLWVTSPGRDKGSTFTFTLKLYDKKDADRINKKFSQSSDAGVIPTTPSAISEESGASKESDEKSDQHN